MSITSSHAAQAIRLAAEKALPQRVLFRVTFNENEGRFWLNAYDPLSQLHGACGLEVALLQSKHWFGAVQHEVAALARKLDEVTS